MARAPRNTKAEYARRVAKGMAAGKTRQQARGHLPREKARTVERQRAKSPAYLTETDRRFLRKQLARTGDRYEARRYGGGQVHYEIVEGRVSRWERSRAAYIAMTPEQRDEWRHFQQGLARAKRRDPHFQLDEYVDPVTGRTWEQLYRNMPTIDEREYDILGVPLIFYTPV